MKPFAPLIAISLIVSAEAEEIPKVFQGLFVRDVPVKGEIGMTLPPKEIDKYLAKVGTAMEKDPQFYREYSKSTKPGLPLPYDERIGLTKEEHAEYLALWDKRTFRAKKKGDVTLLLRQGSDGTWSVTATGDASAVTTLRYDAKEDVFRSPNGVLKRIDDIKTDPSNILGEWSGHEWKYEEETTFGKIKENIAFGSQADRKFGLILYRVQELSTTGTPLINKSFIVRFPLGATGSSKPGAKPKPGAIPAKPGAKR